MRTVSDNLKSFDVIEEAPPPPEPEIAEPQAAREAPEPEGAASPENLRAAASPLVLPPPVIPIPQPPLIVAAPVPGPGSQAEAGGGDRPGPGTGSGGSGEGTGSGGSGSGPGGGGVAVHAERIKGRIKPSDYPRSADRAHASGTVFVRVVVGTDGRVSDCAIQESSGREDLDSVTCALITQRYRYRPATDREGRPVPEVIHMAQEWEMTRR